MKYEEIKLLKQSEKSTVYLVRAAEGGKQVYVRKRLNGQHPIYQTLRDCPHPCLPKLYEVTVEEDSTTVIEEYIEGRIPDGTQLPRKQLRGICGSSAVCWSFCTKRVSFIGISSHPTYC